MTKVRIDFALAQDSLSALEGFFRTKDSIRRLHIQTDPGRTAFREHSSFEELTSIREGDLQQQLSTSTFNFERALRPDLVKDEHSLQEKQYLSDLKRDITAKSVSPFTTLSWVPLVFFSFR